MTYNKGFNVVFIVIREYENLGIGYLSSVLENEGFKTRVLDFRKGNKAILAALRKIKPSIVGFSVVYQYNIDKFGKLANYLKENGINCHFTAGGHYATVRYRELFDLIPSLDSIIRSEGEYTMLELAIALYKGKNWKNIKSIVCKQAKQLTINPLRPLVTDLDLLPYPRRAPLEKYVFDRKFATLIASRGCLYDCSFCNLKEFYRDHGTKSKRYRSPEKVVDEINYLYKSRKCTIFLFQDDDFPVNIKKDTDWIIRFCETLIKKKLADKILWKINCRPDEIDPRLFYYLKALGLFLVFLGIEDGTDEGLKRLNKHITAEEVLRSVNALKELKIGLDYGFLLFQPSTSFESLRKNLLFLRNICGDGYSAVTFLKLMPYYDTPDERFLITQGRLKGPPGYRDYNFLDIQMDRYFELITDCTISWIREPCGVLNLSKWIRNFFLIHDHLYFYKNNLKSLNEEFISMMKESNEFLLDSMLKLSVEFESGNILTENPAYLNDIRKSFHKKHEIYRVKMTDLLSRLKIASLAYACIQF